MTAQQRQEQESLWMHEKRAAALLLSQELADRLDLVVRHPGAVDPHLLVGAGRDEDHVAAPEQRLGAVRVEDGARVDFRRHLEGDPCREIRLDEPGHDID